MLEALVATILNRVLGDYVSNLNYDQLKIAIWNGEVNLSNLKLRKDALDKLRLPIDVVEGNLGELTLSIPWSNLKTKPVKVHIKNVYLLAAPKTETTVNLKDEEERAQQLKQEKLETAELLEASKNDIKKGGNDASNSNGGFVQQLTTKVIDNLQLSFQNIHLRYEDQISCPDQPFAVGVTLKELSAISTDGDWQPAFIGDLANTIHKLVTLNSLSVYWNTGSTSLAGLPSDQASQIYTDLIPTSDNALKEHQYIVHPVSGVGKIKLNKVYDEKVAQVDTTLLFEELAFGLDNEQYRDALLLVDQFHSNLKKQQHLKFRPPPGTTPKSDPKAFFKYAGQTVLSRIHERNYKWTWDHFKKRRDERLAYVDTYLAQQRNNANSQQKAQLAQLERDLTYEDIRFYRSIAKRHLRKHMELDAKSKQKKAKKGWFGSLWSSQDSTSNDDTKDSLADNDSGSMVLTDEQRKELYDAIDYDEGKDSIGNDMDIPKDTMKFALNTTLSRGSIKLIQQPHSTKHELASIVLDAVGIQAIQYASSMKVSTSLGDLQLYDGSTKDTLYPQLIGVKKDWKKGTSSLVDAKHAGENLTGDQATQISHDQQPFLAIDYQNKPLDKKADQAIKVVMQHLEIIYNPTVIQETLSFFKGPTTDNESFDALVEIAGDTLEGFRRQTRAGLQYALENHTTLDLALDMKAPIIIIPENCLKEDSAAVIVDTGHIRVNSDLANQDILDEFKTDKVKTYSADDYKRLETLMYDKFLIELNQVKVIAGLNIKKCLAQLDMVSSNVPDGSDEYVLYGVDLNLLVEQCILPGVSQFAKLRVCGKVPLVSMNLSPRKYKALMMVVNRITSSKDNGSNNESTNGKRRQLIGTQKQHDVSSHVDDDSSSTHSTPNNDKATTLHQGGSGGVQLDFSFDTDLLCLELFNDPDTDDNNSKPTSFCRLSFDNTSAKLLTTTEQAMQMEVQIQSINLCDTRDDTIAQFKDILPAGKQLDGPQIQLRYETGKKTTDGSPITNIAATLDRPQVIFSLDYIMLLKEFFAPPDMLPPAPTEAQVYAASLHEIELDKQALSKSSTNAEKPSTSVLHLNISVVGLEIVCLANPHIPHSEAMVLSFKQLAVRQQEQLALRLDGIGLFLCRMDNRTKSLVSLVKPFGVELDMLTQTPSPGQKDITINSCVQPVTLRISYHDILLINDIINKATAISGKRTDDGPSANYGDDDKCSVNEYVDGVLDSTSLLSPGSRLTKHKLSEEKQTQHTAKLQSPSNQVNEVVSRETVNARFEQFQLILVEDLHDLSFMDFVIKPFNVSVSDWTKSLTVNTQLSTQFNYFNFKNSLWEPLIEPYDFEFNVKQDPVTKAKDIAVSSTKTLNVNLSHVFLETALSITSTLSEIQPLVESRQKQIKPFVIENRTGYDMRFWNMSDDSQDGDTNICMLKNGEDQDWTFRDWEKQKDSLEMHDTLLGVELLQTNWENICHISIDVVGNKSYRLKNGREDQHRLVVEVELKNHVKHITFHGGLVVDNQSENSMQITMVDESRKSTSPIWTIDSKNHLYVPIGISYSPLLSVRPSDEYHWNEQLVHWLDMGMTKASTLVSCKSLGTTSPKYMYYVRALSDVKKAISQQRPITKIQFGPPIEITNNLPFTFEWTMVDQVTGQRMSAVIESGKSGHLQTFGCGGKLAFTMDIQHEDYGTTDLTTIPSTDTAPEDGIPVRLTNKAGNSVYLRMSYRRDKDAQYGLRITMYASHLLINKSGCPISLRLPESKTGKLTYNIPAGDSQVTPQMFSYPKTDSKNRAEIAIGGSNWSQGLSLEVVGSSQDIQLENGKEYEINAGIHITEGTGLYHSTKLVTVSPRFILKNNTRLNLQLAEYDSNDSISLGTQEELPLYMTRKARSFKWLCLQVPNAEYQSSAPFDIQEIGTTFIKLHKDSGSKPILIKASVAVKHATVFVTFNQAKDWPYLIINGSSTDVTIYQETSGDGNMKKDKKTPAQPRKYLLTAEEKYMEYSWDMPTAKERRLVLEVEGKTRILDINAIGSQIPFKYKKPQNGSGGGTLAIDVASRDASLVLLLTDFKEDTSLFRPTSSTGSTVTSSSSSSKSSASSGHFETVDVEFAVNFTFKLQLQGIGISIVDRKPQEILYASFRGIDIKYLDSNLYQSIRTSIQWVEIDNQLYGSTYPILCYPSTLPKNPPPGTNVRPTFHLALDKVKDSSHGVTYFKLFSVLLQEITIELDEDLLYALIDFSQFDIGKQQEKTNVSPHSFDAKMEAPPGNDNEALFYFEEFCIQPMRLNISFVRTARVNTVDINENTNSPFAYLFDVLTMTIGNINDAPIKLNALMVENLRANPQDISSKVILHYQSQVIYQIYRVLGSADLIGNPVGLFNNLSSGVGELFYEPYQGFIASDRPQDLGIGIARGVGGLLKKSVFGVTDSLSRITGSLGKGLAAATMDDKFEERRRMKMTRNKPQHAIFGVTQGVTYLGTGLASGVVGLVKQPMEGAGKSGVGGFFGGLGKGLVGAVTKPVVGVFDLANNVTAGIRETTTLFDEGALVKERLPRFIGKDGALMIYSQQQALGQSWMKEMNDGSYSQEKYIAHSLTNTEEQAVIVTSQHLFLVHTRKLAVVWAEKLENLDTCHWVTNNKGGQLVIQTKSKNNQVKPIQLMEPSSGQLFAKQVQTTLNRLRDEQQNWQ